MELIRNSCEIEGTVGIVITRKGKKISEMNMKNTSFPIAAANCFSGVPTQMPTKVIMTAGTTNHIIPQSGTPTATANEITYTCGASDFGTGTTTNWTLTLKDGASNTTAGNTWATTQVNPISARVYLGDTFTVYWKHTVTGLSTPGNNFVANYFMTGAGQGVDKIGVADSVTLSTGALVNLKNATFDTKWSVISPPRSVVTGTFPNSAGEPYPSSNNRVGWVGIGTTAYSAMSIDEAIRDAAANRRASLNFKTDFS